jgi:hypothetical protein
MTVITRDDGRKQWAYSAISRGAFFKQTVWKHLSQVAAWLFATRNGALRVRGVRNARP